MVPETNTSLQSQGSIDTELWVQRSHNVSAILSYSFLAVALIFETKEWFKELVPRNISALCRSWFILHAKTSTRTGFSGINHSHLSGYTIKQWCSCAAKRRLAPWVDWINFSTTTMLRQILTLIQRQDLEWFLRQVTNIMYTLSLMRLSLRETKSSCALC